MKSLLLLLLCMSYSVPVWANTCPGYTELKIELESLKDKVTRLEVDRVDFLGGSTIFENSGELVIQPPGNFIRFFGPSDLQMVYAVDGVKLGGTPMLELGVADDTPVHLGMRQDGVGNIGTSNNHRPSHIFAKDKLVVGNTHITPNLFTTVGTSGTASQLPNRPLGYLQIVNNGVGARVPYYKE